MSLAVIQVEVRLVYGRPAVYPLNDAAKRLAELAGTKTLKPNDLRIARDLGFQVEEINPAKLPTLGGVH